VAFIFCCLAKADVLMAQAPEKISYQAVLRGADGMPIASQTGVLSISILNNAVDGPAVYEESHNNLATNSQGLITCQIGNGVLVDGSPSFATIDWGGGAKYLSVSWNGQNIGTQQLISVPYSLYSKSAEKAKSVEFSVSLTGDTLFTGGGDFLIIPQISASNFSPGCTNPAACNFSALAEVNDGSCLIIGMVCDDNNLVTENDVVTANCECLGTPQPGVQTGGTLGIGGSFCTNKVISTTGCGGVTTSYVDGTVYDIVEFEDSDGNKQCWMAENLRSTTYRNGDPIATLAPAQWEGSTQGLYSIYNNDVSLQTTYGNLYNWFAINDSRGICPVGWHVPSDCDWMFLEDAMGMTVADQVAAGDRQSGDLGRLKDTNNWNAPNDGAVNFNGFAAQPGGSILGSTGNWNWTLKGAWGYYWSSSSANNSVAWYRYFGSTSTGIIRTTNSMRYGFSVRCVKD
jgi:uncharacterized protein (TIGR02145 family)